MKSKIIIFFTLFILLFNVLSFGFYSNFPIWQELDVLSTNALSNSNLITLESESAILIEQTTRRNSL